MTKGMERMIYLHLHQDASSTPVKSGHQDMVLSLHQNKMMLICPICHAYFKRHLLPVLFAKQPPQQQTTRYLKRFPKALWAFQCVLKSNQSIPTPVLDRTRGNGMDQTHYIFELYFQLWISWLISHNHNVFIVASMMNSSNYIYTEM